MEMQNDSRAYQHFFPPATVLEQKYFRQKWTVYPIKSTLTYMKRKNKTEDFSVIVWFFETGYNSSHRILVQRYSAKYLFPLQKNVGLRFFINGKVFHTWSKHQLFIHLLHFIFYISGKPCSDSWIWMHILDQHFSTSWLFIYLMLNKVTLTKCE